MSMHLFSGFVRGLLALLITSLMLSAPMIAQGQDAQDAPIPELTSWVTDATNTLSPSVNESLTKKLAALDRDKGAQIAVLMIPTTQNESIESYATRAFAQWQLGRKGVDDGILLVVAKEDRRLRIEVGYGLEGTVPDVLAGRIIREQITPHFRTGDFSAGVVAGVDSLITLVQGEALPPPVKGAQGSQADDQPWIMLLALAFMAVIMPLGIPTLFIGVFAGIAFGSVMIGVATVIGAAAVGILARALGIGNTRQTVAASRRGGGRLGRAGRYGAGGFAAGAGGGFGGGGFGGGGMGGGVGGGGGGSGGGGASGSW